MKDGPYLEVHRLEASKSTFHFGEILVGPHTVLRREVLWLHRGANHVDPIQLRLFRDPSLVAAVGKTVVADRQLEMLADLILVQYTPGAHANLGLARQPVPGSPG